ncbi:hypothetical protein ACYZUC_02720 [Pseudomonas sp. GT1P32]
MISTAVDSGFFDRQSRYSLSLLTAPTVRFSAYEVVRVFLPLLVDYRPGEVTTHISDPALAPGDCVYVTWLGDEGKYEAEPHPVISSGLQQVAIPDAAVLMHSGGTVYVSYTVSHPDGTQSNSHAFSFVVATGELDIDHLPDVDIVEARDGVLKLADIPNGATFRIPPIRGLHRGMFLGLRIYSTTGGIPCGPDVPPPCGPGVEYLLELQQIRTTAEGFLSFRVDPAVLRTLIGKESRAGYAIELLDGLLYNKGGLSGLFRVEM